MGLRFDFNDGCRVMLPEMGRPWRVRLSDLETGNLLFDVELRSGHVNSSKRYFVRFRLEVWADGESVLCHDYGAADRDVLIQFPIGTIGDLIGWMAYAVKFEQLHHCRLTCAIGAPLIPLFRDAYPDIAFITHEAVEAERFYATYSIGLFFDDPEQVHQPCDFRQVGLHRTAGYILGVDPTEMPPYIVLADDTRPIPDPYVCIAVQATTQCKYWNNPDGWREITAFLKHAGYRVICIDQKPVHGHGLVWNHIPDGAEDETGDRPLQERGRWLKHAAAFIGLSSGLSWLAWAVGTPVVMISGFTHPINEFSTPYRVINYHACNSCWNDVRHRFDHTDFLWCPRHKDTPRQFECTRLITAEQVKTTLRRIPGLAIHPADAASTTAPAWVRDLPPHSAADPVAPSAEGADADAALAVSALLERGSAGVHRGGLAVGMTVKAGELKDQAAGHIARGDRTSSQGDLDAALGSYREGLAIMRRLSAADGGNASFQRDLSVALNRIGAVLSARGDEQGASDTYRDSLAIMERLVAAHPGNAGFTRDLAWCRAMVANAPGRR